MPRAKLVGHKAQTCAQTVWPQSPSSLLLPCHPPSEGRRRRVLTEVIEQGRKSKWLGCAEATTTQRTTETLESSSLHRTLKTVETVATPVRRGVNWMTQSPANM